MTFEFIADRPVLDFVSTVAERGTTDLDSLTDPDDMARWALESGLTSDVLRLDRADLIRAVEARETLFSLVAALIDDRPLGPRDRARVNAMAARPGPRLEIDGRQRVRRHADLDAVLSALATDALDLVDSPDRAQLRWCDDPLCTRPFVDRSRGGRRRWCGMAGCGDRAKAAAYRDRRRHAAGGVRQR